MTSTLSLSAVLVVALGGALGSVARYTVGVLLLPASGGFPTGTLVVNVVGAFLIGCFARLTLTSESDQLLRLALTTGFCGGFTTFSALSAETIALMQQGRTARAGLYVVSSLVLGLGATALGYLITKPRTAP
ncbi:MAG TPA: fluoride efflux transporter CrcB [Gemmatimonas aurantiaca]|uniref:Fluoride-specific ion channel FluC n=2 Tax=Gemmatimonas aurantiaca TaxID=173480 RepID=C1A5H5_GEMAT|nr:fluoride efflux transporter CrcB [Gemmatimonas aurantiaca]BAH37485.1 CrcB protein [Gemmatimonas aurantiaca T-27]HCT55900.1 fluoride efflux transporter CrcB [Gemmatimonas aurantiaca]